MLKLIKQLFCDLTKDIFAHNIKIQEFSLEIPRNPEHGDLATNIAMVLAKLLQKNPRQIAENIIEKIKTQDFFHRYIKKIELAGQGFINLHIQPSLWHEILGQIEQDPANYGKPEIKNKQAINIEFVSANPTGPLHVGHSRPAVYGDVIANLLQFCDHNVTREYYINDAGNQIDVLLKSLFIRYNQLYGSEETIPPGCYPGEYLIELAELARAQYGDKLLTMPEVERRNLLWPFAINNLLSQIKESLAKLGVHFDKFTSEKLDIVDKDALNSVQDLLKAKGLIYIGTLERPKSDENEDWEPREQLLFRTSNFGDESDRVLEKSDGTPTYFASDIAYQNDKLKRNFDKLIVLLGADHIGYVTRLKAAVTAISGDKNKLEVITNQMVNLLKDGAPLKMSKRKGNFITLDEVLEEVGKDILRFSMLTRKNDTILTIDLDQVLEQSKENQFFYIQYAHTRVVSTLQRAYESELLHSDELKISKAVDVLAASRVSYAKSDLFLPDIQLLTREEELDIMRHLAFFPQIIDNSASRYDLHILINYLFDLANKFHILWTKGMENKEDRLVREDNIALSRARIYLAFNVARSIGQCLAILGIEPLIKM